MTAQTSQFKNQKGFTLIELLVVIGILAILLAITLIAINPARQFGNANNTARRSHVSQILNAVGAYSAENKGQLPSQITTTATEISKAGIDLCAVLVPNYVPALPTNPSNNSSDIDSVACSTNYTTGYLIVKDANNRVTVSADPAKTDNGAVISVTR